MMSNLFAGIREAIGLLRLLSPTVLKVDIRTTLIERLELMEGDQKEWLKARYGFWLSGAKLRWHVLPISIRDLTVEDDTITFEFLFWSRQDALLFKLACGGAV
jgi:hypothetical protein